VIRAAPTPLYNRHIDCLRFVLAVREWMRRAVERSRDGLVRPERPHLKFV
jgi:hypothetical protein